MSHSNRHETDQQTLTPLLTYKLYSFGHFCNTKRKSWQLATWSATAFKIIFHKTEKQNKDQRRVLCDCPEQDSKNNDKRNDVNNQELLTSLPSVNV